MSETWRKYGLTVSNWNTRYYPSEILRLIEIAKKIKRLPVYSQVTLTGLLNNLCVQVDIIEAAEKESKYETE